MTISLKHKFVSAVPDDGDTSRVRPSNWNDEHNIHMASGFMLGRLTSGAGDVEEISAAALLTWSGAVVGPAAATNNAIPRFDGTTGKLIQNSAATIDASGNMAVPGQMLIGSGGYIQSIGNATDATIRQHVTGGATGWAIGLNRPGDVFDTTYRWSSLAAGTWTTRMSLTASGDLTAGPTIQARRGSAGDVTLSMFQTGVTDWQLVNRGTTGLLDFTNGTVTPITLAPSTGHVGIGTGAAGAYRLDVLHTANSQTGARVKNADNGANAGASIFLEGAIANSSLQFNLWANSGSPYAQIAAASALTGLYVDAVLHVWRSAAQVEWARIDASGRMIVGHTASIPVGSTNAASPQVQMHGTDGHNVMTLYRWSADANASVFDFFKSRGATKGTRGIVQSGDVLGTITWRGDDGANSPTAAHIRAVVDGTPGAGDMPTRLEWATTPDGSSSPVLRGSVNSAGRWLLSGDLTIGFASLSPYAPKAHFGGVTAAATPTLGAVTGVTAMFSNTDSAYGLAVGSTAGGASWVQVQRIDGTATAYNLLLQPSGGFVGIVGSTAPDAPLTIGAAANRPNPGSGYLVKSYGAGNSYWGLFANTNFNSGVHFGDPADDDVGKIEYAHNGDYMSFWTNAAERMRITSDGNALFGRTSSLGYAERLTIQCPAGGYGYVITDATYATNVMRFSNSFGVEMGNIGGSPMHLITSNIARISMMADGKVGISTVNPTAVFDVNGDVAHRMAALTVANGANQNVSRPAFSALRISAPTAAFNIGGLTAGADGIEAELINTTAHQMTLNNEDGGSTAGNRIITDTGGNLNCKHAVLRYDPTSTRWRVVSFRT